MTEEEKNACMNPVSMVRLIAHPKDFNGKMVSVEGLLHVQFEDQRLYLSRDDGNYLITANALSIAFAPSNLLLETNQRVNEKNGPKNAKQLPKDPNRALRYFDNKFVLLVGKFSAGKYAEDYGDYSLHDVSRVMELTRWGNLP